MMRPHQVSDARKQRLDLRQPVPLRDHERLDLAGRAMVERRDQRVIAGAGRFFAPQPGRVRPYILTIR